MRQRALSLWLHNQTLELQHAFLEKVSMALRFGAPIASAAATLRGKELRIGTILDPALEEGIGGVSIRAIGWRPDRRAVRLSERLRVHRGRAKAGAATPPLRADRPGGQR